ncbi:GTP-binding protein, partial [Clostridium sp.]|uniref:GTP-binding protein n=1 Tax=Clostridium sp. TaxID=1506 RepID=UPI003464CA72
TIGILAHVDAGKTTFAEQILYHTHSIKERGRVDHKSAFLDSNNLERERGITIFSDEGSFTYEGDNYFLVDTPGHIDFSTEMERSIGIMDYAIIIISAVEGIQGHTETLWDLLKKYKIPTFFFINKVDREGADIKRVVEEIKEKFSKDIYFFHEGFNENEMEESLIEFIAERDEDLLSIYLEGNYDSTLWIKSMKYLVKKGEMFPAFSGSALLDIGIKDFLEKLHSLTYTEYKDKDNFGGMVYKVRHDENGVRVTYIKGLKGSLKVRDEICYEKHGERIHEKVTQIRRYNGNKFKPLDEVLPGEIFAVTGLTSVKVGQGVGDFQSETKYNMVPTLKSKVIFSEELNIKDVFKSFKILEEEDPSLNILWHEKLKEIHVHIMGTIQLEVLKKVIEQRFKFQVDFGPCEILYKETIDGSVNGYGHFEPLGHYSEVHINIENGEPGSGIVFENLCHVDDLSIGHQNLIYKHIFERDHNGILTGYPLTDLKITLLTGRAHNKHTSGGDFREATYRSLRQGLEKAENILLEPYYDFKFEVDIDKVGRLISDIQKLHGKFTGPELFNERAVIKGMGPVATFMNYPLEFVALTKGRGSYSFTFKGYDICHNSEEVIRNIGYNKDEDIDYTSNSIFCSKGQGYVVKGNEAESHMHCEIEEI